MHGQQNVKKKTLYAFALPTVRGTFPVHAVLLDLMHQILSTKDVEVHYAILSSPRYFISLSSKYRNQHPTLKHPQPTFIPCCDRSSFTPT